MRVIDGLVLVLLSVELDEESEVRPAEVDASRAHALSVRTRLT
jgi:hypothetical protein